MEKITVEIEWLPKSEWKLKVGVHMIGKGDKVYE